MNKDKNNDQDKIRFDKEKFRRNVVTKINGGYLLYVILEDDHCWYYIKDSQLWIFGSNLNRQDIFSASTTINSPCSLHFAITSKRWLWHDSFVDVIKKYAPEILLLEMW